MKKSIFIFAAVALTIIVAAGCSDDFGNWLSGFDTEGTEDDIDSILEGKAYLQNQKDHSFIRVTLSAGISLLTNAEGTFELPADLSEGDWTVEALYPYYHSAQQTFSVSNGVPAKRLSTMELDQAVKYTVTTNGTFFTHGSTVIMTVAAENVSTKSIRLASSTSPMAAYAVRRDNATLAGGLFPGDEEGGEEVVLDPGDIYYFELRWKITDPNILAGNCKLYAVLATDITHPEFFDKSSSATPGFNDSLYTKLDPVEITIQ